MVQGEPKEHLTNCYFCLVNTKGIGKKNRLNISYPSIPSAIRPVLHSDEFPPPVFNGFVSSEDEETESEEEHIEMAYKQTDTESEDLSTESKKAVPQQINQLELNDLVHDLDLSKQAAEILAFRLKEKLVLHCSAKVSFHRKKMSSFCLILKRRNNLFIVTMYQDFSANQASHQTTKKSGDFFWTAPSAASSFYTKGIGMKLFLVVTPLYFKSSRMILEQ